MDASRDLPDAFDLDILVANQPRINRLYTQLTLCFKLRDGSQLIQSDIVDTLSKGIERLSRDFPWVAGKVIINENETSKIITSKKHTIPLVIKDYRTDATLPSFAELKAANFPFSMLDECVIAPYNTLTDPTLSKELPVLAIQANFLAGAGLLLTINGQHGAMDMAGQSQVMYLVGKACRDEPFTAEEVEVGNMDRGNVIPLLLDDADTHDPAAVEPAEQPQTRKPVSAPDEDEGRARLRETSSPPDLTWAYFAFASSSLVELKALATQDIPGDTFVSTDDVLTAQAWQSITRARLPRLEGDGSQPPTTTTTLSRNVDMRRYLSLPATYTGFMTDSTTHRAIPKTLLESPLGRVASDLRSALLDADTLRRQTRVKATRESRGADRLKKPDSAPPPSAPAARPTLEVRLSSWAKENSHELDFGFGRPVAVRRPRFAHGAREGLVYFLPRAPDGEVLVGVCLAAEDLERLKRDEAFGRWARFVG